MKIIFKIFLTALLLFGLFQEISVHAEEEPANVIVTVSEKIPGAECEDILIGGSTDFGPTLKTGRYKCTIKGGFASIIFMMGKIVKYFTFIAGLGGVLFIVLNGIMYSMSGMEPAMKDDAKKRITGTILGLVLLLISGVILKLVAPWVYV